MMQFVGRPAPESGGQNSGIERAYSGANSKFRFGYPMMFDSRVG